MFRSQYNIVKGFPADVENLLKKFCEAESVRYEEFCQVWRDMKMSYIFAGRSDPKELREFTEECFRVVLDLWNSTESLQMKVGTFYILFAMYFKQGQYPPVQIRITPVLWEGMQLFMQEMHNQEHLDVEYMFYKLRWNNAFRFVATAMPVYVERISGLDLGVSDQGGMSGVEPSIVSEIVATDNIDQLSTIHEEYHRMKCHIAGPEATEPTQSLNVIERNLVQYITKAVAGHEDWKRRKGESRKRRESGGAMTTSESEADSDGETVHTSTKKSQPSVRDKRAEIRARAFSQAPSATIVRHNRHKTSSESESTAGGSPRKGRAPELSQSSADDTLDTSLDDVVFPILTMSNTGKSRGKKGVLDASEEEAPSTIKPEGKGRGRGARTRGGKSRTNAVLDMPNLVGGPETPQNKSSRGGKQSNRKSKAQESKHRGESEMFSLNLKTEQTSPDAAEIVQENTQESETPTSGKPGKTPARKRARKSSPNVSNKRTKSDSTPGNSDEKGVCEDGEQEERKKGKRGTPRGRGRGSGRGRGRSKTK